MNKSTFLIYIGYMSIALVLGVIIGFIIIYSYKLIKKLTKRKESSKNKEIKGISTSFSTELVQDSNEYNIDIDYDFDLPSFSSPQYNLYPNQKILETSSEEITFNTTNTLKRLIDIDTAKKQANHISVV
ncbi:hypothetical protein BCR36DRAFT_412003 [Piromyces finnis]|uniref:Uncharacterized protein n=1 Tax=Piromyces finnis TaxID=1754191 RepID=A0A1Y1VA92_9FUNG|nr:hypothetical protein BCR36DRAFT_412003 [Piromyces finnis]|eukprot:ORX51018.1 hypothetical protein BCR36DRAFT_412003 [Piromyces finnis]